MGSSSSPQSSENQRLFLFLCSSIQRMQFHIFLVCLQMYKNETHEWLDLFLFFSVCSDFVSLVAFHSHPDFDLFCYL